MRCNFTSITFTRPRCTRSRLFKTKSTSNWKCIWLYRKGYFPFEHGRVCSRSDPRFRRVPRYTTVNVSFSGSSVFCLFITVWNVDLENNMFSTIKSLNAHDLNIQVDIMFINICLGISIQLHVIKFGRIQQNSNDEVKKVTSMNYLDFLDSLIVTLLSFSSRVHVHIQ